VNRREASKGERLAIHESMSKTFAAISAHRGASAIRVVLRLTWGFALASAFAGCLGAEQNPASGEPTVDASRMLADLTFLASDSLEGRETGSDGNRIAREYIAQAFGDMGLAQFQESWVQAFSFGRGAVTFHGGNVVGFVEGTAMQDSFIVVTAHFDHVGVRNGEIYNGATALTTMHPALPPSWHSLPTSPSTLRHTRRFSPPWTRRRRESVEPGRLSPIPPCPSSKLS
jgi:hypothetical protein